MTEPKFTLRCTGCGLAVNPPALHCRECNGLLRAEYAVATFHPGDRGNLFNFHDWLPPQKAIETEVGPTAYRSEGLAHRLGMSELVIGFNGYAPEVGASNPTGTFKDFEALPTLLHVREHGIDGLVLSSAGNTARAFAYAACQLGIPVVIVVPEGALERLWLPCRPSEHVRLVAIEDSDDYAFATRTAALVSEIFSIPPEGGARNVARRDGMGTAVLEASRQLGRLPQHYVQAIGSGTGAIAAWEASQRLVNAGFDGPLPQLHLAQNAPFAPIHDAWTADKPIDPDHDVDGQLARIAQIDAFVLANRRPPYAVSGGVYDALVATGGSTCAIPNAEARAAADLFLKTEGLPIGPAAAVAVAALLRGVNEGRIARDETILLHITGNNELLVRRDFELHSMEPMLRLRPEQVNAHEIERHRAKILP